MHPVLFSIGGFTVYTYGLFVAVAVIVSFIYSLKTRPENVLKDQCFDLYFWALIPGFFAARILYIIVEWDAFLRTPYVILFSRSGFVFYGGIIGGVLGCWFFIKKKTLPFWKIADWIAPAIALGHSIGRLGCFFNGCCYGRITNSRFGIFFPSDNIGPLVFLKRIPTQLFAAIALFIIFLILVLFRKKQRYEGQAFLLYLIIYGLFRFFIEFLRDDPRGFIGVWSTSQWISIILIVFSFPALIIKYKRYIKEKV